MTWHPERRRGANRNPIPRTNVASCELYLELNEKLIQQITISVLHKSKLDRRNCYEFLIEDIRQTVILAFCREYKLYCDGIIDKFPPYPGYLFKSAFFEFKKDYCHHGDIMNTVMDFYDTSENSYETEHSKGMGSGRKILTQVATKYQHVPLNYNDPDINATSKVPDIVDLWNTNFSILELAFIYNLHPTTVRKRLHSYYDAMERSGAKLLRPRPRKSVPHKNIFKTPKKV